MRIITSHYDFWIEDLTKYFIQNNNQSESISYVLYSIENSSETILGEYIILAGESKQLEIIDEGIYKVYIKYALLPKDELPNYTIKHFPSLKQSIIDLMKNAICDCSLLDSSCTEKGLEPTKINNYNTQLLLSYQGFYLHSLLSQDFTRDYRKCFDITLTDDSKRLIDLLESYYTDVLINGNTSSRIHLLRLYLAYLYLLIYTIEKDIASYVTDNGSSQEGEVTLVEEMFNIKEAGLCFDNLNIDYVSVIEKLSSCYKTKPMGSEPIPEDVFKTMYYGINVTGDFPTDDDIKNATQSKIITDDYVELSPNTEDNQYLWIAVPVVFSENPFNSWEAVGSSQNFGTITQYDDINASLIVLKQVTHVVMGIEFYIYIFKYPSMFIATLKLSIK